MLHPLRVVAASIGFATLYVACVTGGGGYPGFGADVTTAPSSSSSGGGSSSTSCNCAVENEGASATLTCGTSQCVGGSAFTCSTDGELTQGLDCGSGVGGSTTGSGGMDGGGMGGSSTTTTSSSSSSSSGSTACLSLGTACSLGDKCCSGALCESRCCIGVTQSGCTTDADCCGGSCVGSPVPVCCSQSGQPCTTSTECCAGLGLSCSGGMCQ